MTHDDDDPVLADPFSCPRCEDGGGKVCGQCVEELVLSRRRDIADDVNGECSICGAMDGEECREGCGEKADE